MSERRTKVTRLSAVPQLAEDEAVYLIPRRVLLEMTSKLDLLLKTVTRPLQNVGYLPQPAMYISRADAATITGYSTRTIDRLITAGRLPAYGTRSDRVRRSELDALMCDLPAQGEDVGEDIAVTEALARLHSDKPKTGG